MCKEDLVTAVSIAVHEAPQALDDQIENIKKYIRHPIIVIHISAGQCENFPIDKLRKKKHVFVNPEHLHTSWGDIVRVHLSNFIYISRQTTFDYFVLHASNDCYVKKGMERYIGKYRAGFNRRRVNEKTSGWCMAQPAVADPVLQQVSRECGNKGIVASQAEGSFYSYEIMLTVVKKLSGRLLSDTDWSYTKEEFFFSTAAYGMLSEKEIGYPIVFSEVHRFDRMYYRYLDVSRRIFRGTYENRMKNIADGLVLRILRRGNWYGLSKKDICAVRERNYRQLLKNQFLDDGSGEFQLYDPDGLFAVKRVPRNSRHPLRTYIRKLPVK